MSMDAHSDESAPLAAHSSAEVCSTRSAEQAGDAGQVVEALGERGAAGRRRTGAAGAERGVELAPTLEHGIDGGGQVIGGGATVGAGPDGERLGRLVVAQAGEQAAEPATQGAKGDGGVAGGSRGHQRPRAARRVRPTSRRWWWASWIACRPSHTMSRSVGSG